MLDETKWCNTPYEGYQAHPEGFIKGPEGKVLKGIDNGGGYYLFRLYREGRRPSTTRVHRVVAQTFIDNPYNKPEVNHIDGNKLNNAIDNLEWMTAEENRQHAKDTGLIGKGESHSRVILTEVQV